MQNGEKNALQVYLQGRLFLLFYRATALQRGNLFPSCAWRMPLLHRNFSLAFARWFLDLTTFLRQIFRKFKNASAFLLRDARHAKHDIFLLRISAILPEAISDEGLTPTTDTNLLLAA